MGTTLTTFYTVKPSSNALNIQCTSLQNVKHKPCRGRPAEKTWGFGQITNVGYLYTTDMTNLS